MRIRKFKKEDARKVSNLIKKCLIEVNSKDYPKKVIEFMCSHLSPRNIIDKSAKRKVYVAVEKGNILGTASLKKNMILTVFVNPDLHGKGIGKRLMAKVEEEAKKEGYKTAELPSSITSVSFYKRLGYRRIKETHGDNFGKTILMRKDL